MANAKLERREKKTLFKIRWQSTNFGGTRWDAMMVDERRVMRMRKGNFNSRHEPR
jgi:hypothetical protein